MAVVVSGDNDPSVPLDDVRLQNHNEREHRPAAMAWD